MNLQMTISKKELASKIKEFYDFCGYEVEKKQIIELSGLILESLPGITLQQFDSFILTSKLGENGMIYKSPISLMVALNEFNKSYKQELSPDDPRMISDIDAWKPLQK